MTTHQNNYSKILSLRNTSSALDAQIKETLTLLTATRRTLLDTPSTTFTSATNLVSYSELLSYARRVSKFTLPSTYRESEPSADGPDGATPKESKSEPHTNGTTTPITVPNGVDKDIQMSGTTFAVDNDNGTPTNGTSQAQISQETTTSGTALPQDFTQYLNPGAEIPFIPWPSEEAIRKGALASIQILLDQGVDPATFDPERSAELEEERKKVAEEKDRAMEEQRVRVEEDRRREMERRMSVSGAAAAPRGDEGPKVFQLETFDDDEDSE